MDHYTQHRDVDGLQVEASAGVSYHALDEAAWLVRKMVSRRDIRRLSDLEVRLVVVGASEMVTDLPEYSLLMPSIWWDRRYRGAGPTDDLRVILCSEEDLLNAPGDEGQGDNSICLHEIAHAVAFAREHYVPRFKTRLEAAYQHALTANLWPESYSVDSAGEYFVAGAEIWFGQPRPEAALTGVESRSDLRAHDPDLAVLCQESFGTSAWRYLEPRDRVVADQAHLAGLSADETPQFVWPERARWESATEVLAWTEDRPQQSPPSEASTWLVLANHRHESVEVLWVDFEGREVSWFTLRSGEERLQDVYVGHVWAVRAGGRELGRVVVRPGVNYFEIASAPLPALNGADRASWALMDLPLGDVSSAPAVSPVSDDLTWVLFRNRRDEEIILNWIDFDGVPRRMDRIPAGGELLRDAFVGHVWYASEGDTVLGAFVIGDENGRADIQ